VYGVKLTQVLTAEDITAARTVELVDCWVAVANAGGAVGFAFPPVSAAEVGPVADRMIAGLDPDAGRLLLASVDGVLAGWLHLARGPEPLVAHWATVSRVQTHPRFRGRGVGAALMRAVRAVARDEMGLEQLRLYARGGAGLENFYGRLGWTEVGRWPRALRFGPGDDRDEALMLLSPL
jgi:GNAT superfamily N-acetyltransferase